MLFRSMIRHTRFSSVTGVQTCALPIYSRNDPRCIAGIISVHGDLRGGDGHCGTYAPEKTAESGKKLKIFKNLLRISK